LPAWNEFASDVSTGISPTLIPAAAAPLHSFSPHEALKAQNIAVHPMVYPAVEERLAGFGFHFGAAFR
jgi:hypothetical protein